MTTPAVARKQIGETAFRPPDSRKQPVARVVRGRPSPADVRPRHAQRQDGDLGLAVADRVTGRELVRSGLFPCLLNDVTEGIELFNDRGRTRLATIPRAWLSDSTSPIVLRQPDRAGLRGGLAPDGSRAVGYGDDPKTSRSRSCCGVSRTPCSSPPAVHRALFAWFASAPTEAGSSRCFVTVRSFVGERTPPTTSSEVVTPADRRLCVGWSRDQRPLCSRPLEPPRFRGDRSRVERAREVRHRRSPDPHQRVGRWAVDRHSLGESGGSVRTRPVLRLVWLTSLALRTTSGRLECGAGMAVVSAGGMLTVHGEHTRVRIPAEGVGASGRRTATARCSRGSGRDT